MKFPRKLSKERLSLLSKEDRKIYDYEHSGLYVEPAYISNAVNESELYTEEEKQFIINNNKKLFNELFDDLLDNELKEMVGIDEYNKMKESIFNMIENDPDLKPIFEALGHSADWWMDMGWIGKLAAGLLTGLLGLIAWLFMKGKDRLALLKLKQYMNKLVEMVDQGVNKKRPWYSFLMSSKKSKQNTGDYNKACFRTILETAERNMACLYTLTIHSLGFLSPGLSNFNSITSGFMPDEDSGLGKFMELTISINKDAEGIYLPNSDYKLLPMSINTEIFNNLKLPALPTNYKMLMSNIDYPTKANKNPNGSLFMKPTEEILQASGSDLGLTYFNDDVLGKGLYKKEETNEHLYYFDKYDALFEVEGENGLDATEEPEMGPVLTNDLTNNVLGSELKQETEVRSKTLVELFKGDIVDAIDNYIRASIPVITTLTRAICGKEASAELKKIAGEIIKLNDAAEGNMNEYMKKNEVVLKDLLDKEHRDELNNKNKKIEVLKNINRLLSYISDSDFCKVIKLTAVNKLKNSLLKTIDTEKELDNIIDSFTTCSTFEDLKKMYNNFNNKNTNNINNSINYKMIYNLNKLFEDEEEIDTKDIKKNLQESLDNIYKNVKNTLAHDFVVISENDPADWYIIQDSRERMKALKEAADKEINAKIELICRTVSNSSSTDLGDKFKAALSKHPVRAESLKNIWAKYSDDIKDRMESRIRSITGANANSNILITIKQFLSTTYPNLIAILLYYKQIYYLIREFTKKNPINKEAQSEIDNKQNEYNKLQALNVLQNLHII